ncbi:GNAT family N-acetyltransferase [Streptomyces avermitilis]|uniref:GNAT family N-acetyltransferase n=1 Tax=Streptomyces avermitilis TaxID=33903 RepID=UPI0033A365F8
MRLTALSQDPEAYESALRDWSGAGDTEERWRGRLTDVPFNAVLTEGGSPAGMVSVTAPDGDGLAELISLWVPPHARGRGAGDTAVRAALEWAGRQRGVHQVGLGVRPGNDRAVALFARNGFTRARVDEGGELRMTRPVRREAED